MRADLTYLRGPRSNQVNHGRCRASGPSKQRLKGNSNDSLVNFEMANLMDYAMRH